MPSIPATRHALIAFSCTAAVAAQTTHVVGPGGHAQIQAALAAAAPGDVVIVHPGNYPSFQCTIGVTIRAAVNGTAFVIGSSTANLTATLAERRTALH